MHSKLTVTHFNPLPSVRVSPFYNDKFCQIKCCDKNAPSSSSPSSSDRKFRFRLMGRGRGGDKWKLNDIDGSAVQKSVNQWLSKTQHFINEVTSPLVKNGNDLKPTPENMILTDDSDDIFMAEQTIETRTPGGNLSLAAVVSVEQFSRMNGLTGLKMQKIFKALVPESVYSDARNLVEYCCFRFLSRNSSEIHPYLKEPAFRKLIFITMLAWEEPYSKGKDPEDASGKAYLHEKLVGEEAFVRVAPAISGVADRSTAHNLFKALAGDDKGISFTMWSAYLDELLKVHEGRRVYQYQEGPQLSGERILCLGLSRKRPVLKWENNMAWPGKVTLTDKALYFEGLGFGGQKGAIRLDLTGNGAKVEKTRVGPLGSQLFDSAVSVTAGAASKPWVLEFVDLSGEMRRDVWYAFICEVIALYKFIREFGPNDGDQSVNYVFGAHKGKARAATYAINGITRLQALQFIGKLLDDPIKLAQFSFLQSVPYGDIVCQTLAVNCWGGQLVTKNTKGVYGTGESMKSLNQVSENTTHIYDVDGSVYLRKWMRSPSWASSASATFWKSSTRKGLVLSKNLVVGGNTMVEKATAVCRERYMEVEKTQATIDAAMIEGIPSNIDLFKELLLPLTSTIKSIEKLRRWEEPHVTAAFLVLAYALLFRNLLSCLFPALLMIIGAGLMLLKGLREQGRLGRYFGRVTIRDQPSSNTIQKIIALKEAMREVEIYLQNLNVTLLKIRTIFLAGQPQVTTEVALVLLASAATLLIVPFKYIVAFFLFDLFTRELEFRRPMVLRFMSMLKERWDAVPASPVVVLPYVGDETKELNKSREAADTSASESFP